ALVQAVPFAFGRFKSPHKTKVACVLCAFASLREILPLAKTQRRKERLYSTAIRYQLLNSPGAMRGLAFALCALKRLLSFTKGQVMNMPSSDPNLETQRMSVSGRGISGQDHSEEGLRAREDESLSGLRRDHSLVGQTLAGKYLIEEKVAT